MAKSDGQFCVRLGLDPDRSNGSFAVWRLSKAELGEVLKKWRSSTWEQAVKSVTKREGTDGFHPTALHRRTTPAPLKAALPPKSCQRALYHGVGRDTPGLQALKRRCRFVQAHDPHHPDPTVRKKPTGRFDEIFSIYTLNVLNKAKSRQVLQDIYRRLAAGGHATIAVRRDTCR